MIRSLLLCFLLVGFSSKRADAFATFAVPPPQAARSASVAFSPRISSRIGRPKLVSNMSTAGADEKIVTNPSDAFGTPLSKEMEEFNRNSVGFLKKFIFDTLFGGPGRDYARFYALETIARIPYFSYLSALHFYETIGRWRKANYLKIHFAESWNELHHLLIMEELGGADRWFDRFIAQHISVAYYWLVLFLYMYNPTMAYNLNQNVEEHAFATYEQFLAEHGEELKKQPAPAVAKEYYEEGDLYMFDEIQTETCDPRRPEIRNLYDVFVAIRDDEAEHVKTMSALQTDVELSNSHDGTCDIPEAYLQLP